MKDYDIKNKSQHTLSRCLHQTGSEIQEVGMCSYSVRFYAAIFFTNPVLLSWQHRILNLTNNVQNAPSRKLAGSNILMSSLIDGCRDKTSVMSIKQLNTRLFSLRLTYTLYLRLTPPTLQVRGESGLNIGTCRASADLSGDDTEPRKNRDTKITTNNNNTKPYYTQHSCTV